MTAVAIDAYRIPHLRRRELSTQHRGMLSCAAAMAILGGSVPITQTLTSFPHMAGQGLRYALASAVLIPLAARTRWQRPPISHSDWARLALAAVCGLVACNLLLLTALQHGDAPIVATILGCAPIVLGLATPLLARRQPSSRIFIAAAFAVAGTFLLNGSGHLDRTGLLCATGALAAEIVFTLTAASLLNRLGPATVAAATCTLATAMLAALAAMTGEVAAWRLPTVPEAAAIAFLGLILSAISYALWYTGIRAAGTSHAAVTLGIIPVAALATASIHNATTPSPTQIWAVAIVAAGLAIAASTWTPHMPLIAARLRLVLYGLTLIALTSGCQPAPATAPAQPDPAQPVRAYFGALARGDYATAYQLSRSASRWLDGDGLAQGYQPPSGAHIISTTFAPNGNGQQAYVRAQYQLASTVYESTFEVWKNGTEPPDWSITDGATGRLDVVSTSTPHLNIANVDVTTPLTSPRISGGIPSAGFFEVPPGVYIISPATNQPGQGIDIEVPAMWRDGTPVTVTIAATERNPPPRSPQGATV